MALEIQPTLLAGRYRCLSTLGMGGMARVHLAEDERLGRLVAVKQMHSAAPEDSARRFQREARLGASLNHPNVVSVFDIETEAESVLIVMEYVEGETLREAIAQGPLASERALAVVSDIAAALDHIHSNGVVHRDVKPANVLIGKDGVSKLADLGIATAAEFTKITLSGTVLGTAAYMAPEQLEGEDSGPAADVYSLATVAFEALSGRKARLGTAPMEIAHRVATESAPDLRDAWPTAPAGAAEALKRGMAREPADRPSSAGELADSLEHALTERRTTPTRPAPRPTTARRALPSWLPAAAAVAALAVAGGGAILALGGDDDGGSPGSADRPAASEKPAGKRPERDADANPRRDVDAAEPAPAAPAPPAPASQASGSPASLNQRGFALMNQGRYDEAIPLLQRAVRSYGEGSQDLTYAYALYNLGRSLRLAGRAGEAIPILERRLGIPNQTKLVEKELKQAQKDAR